MAIPVLAACGMPKVLQAHLLTNSIYVWQDADRQSHEARQSEGGEQGDPLMPALYAIAQHPAFAAVHTQLREGEAVFAYLDDIYVVAVPERIRELLDACQQALREHACIELNRGETRIWNAAGEEPAHISELRGHGEQPIWTGDSSLPRDRQGLLVLGTPLGTDDDVRGKEADGARPPPHPHPRGPRPASCVATSALLRRPPSQLPPAERPARTHIANCLGSLVHSGDQLPAAAVQASQLALGFGGQGLRSATRSPQIAANLLHALAAPHASGSSAVAAVAQAADHLAAQGYRVPAWAWDAPEPRHPAQADDHDQPGHRLRGWQRYAARACDQRAFERKRWQQALRRNGDEASTCPGKEGNKSGRALSHLEPEDDEAGSVARRGDKPTSERGTVQAPSSSGQFGVRPSGPTSRSRSSCRSNPSYVIYARLLLSHIIRTVPPNVVAPAIRNMMPECLGSAPSDAVYRVAAFAGLPASLGSLGVQNTKRTAPAAYWAVPLWRVFASWRMTDKCTFRACAHVGPTWIRSGGAEVNLYGDHALTVTNMLARAWPWAKHKLVVLGFETSGRSNEDPSRSFLNLFRLHVLCEHRRLDRLG
ncbi:hypothetical protein AK812_SmicGene23838 [Symbiodinium microadriaticum]|uniref:Reverse transcriptase domain-containing protein n=1 Tax=Symbiodinium microadriaticum TaxID=2951 RepID=A0A1Q9DGA4_SYMMI|nr:hypothetical protein AK812_SmicGene23838 [Symbiodinium microadriaticum]